MPKRHLLSLISLEPWEISAIVDRAVDMMRNPHDVQKSLAGKAIGIYFSATSTRTRTSFTIGASRLGASVITYGPHDLQTNTGETLQDTARVLAGYLDALVMRTARRIEEMELLAEQENMAIVNAMSDKEHPTQALADLATLKEHFGYLDGLHMLYVGEGNNTAAALALAISKMRGMQLTLLTPEGYGLPPDMLAYAQTSAQKHQARIAQYHDFASLPKDVDVVYATRWQTTGSSKADPCWREYLTPYRVTQALFERVSRPSGTIFMHDLPALREEDVSAELLDGPYSIAFHQAHNKLFGAMAVLEWCIVGLDIS